jgi:hypothetical protein
MTDQQIDLLRRLMNWHDATGGWDAPVWRELRALPELRKPDVPKKKRYAVTLAQDAIIHATVSVYADCPEDAEELALKINDVRSWTIDWDGAHNLRVIDEALEQTS